MSLDALSLATLTDWLLAQVPVYGLWILGLTTFLSCLALPIPASVVMVAAGGFAAAGDLGVLTALASALGGAVAGDQAGYWLGRRGGAALLARLRAEPKRAALTDKALAVLETRALTGVFLTRWLFAPLGPYANFAGGAVAYDWRRFTLAAVAGEAVWVTLYLGAGWAFAGDLAAARAMLGSVLGLLSAGAVAVGLGLWLKSLLKAPPEA